MDIRRRASGVAVAALLAWTAGSARTAGAQTITAPAPSPQEQRNAAIVKPLVEIGRVRGRTPFCAALAHARPGIDAALAYEYQTPVLMSDLRTFDLGSALGKNKSMNKMERDLNTLIDLATAGRVEVLALRDAANADGVDEHKRAELLGLANALDGAKARQIGFARKLAANLGVLSETPVRSIVDSPLYDRGSGDALAGKGARRQPVPAVDAATGQRTYTETQLDAIENYDKKQSAFGAFSGEDQIVADLEVASKHATTAMQLGGCSSTQ